MMVLEFNHKGKAILIKAKELPTMKLISGSNPLTIVMTQLDCSEAYTTLGVPTTPNLQLKRH